MTSIHHPISVDRRIELAAARGLFQLSLTRLAKRRWYSFVRMQAPGRPPAAAPILTASQSSRDDICRDFKVPPGSVRVIPLGVDTRLFHPRRHPASPAGSSPWPAPTRRSRASARCCGRSPSCSRSGKRTLIVVGKPAPGGPTERLVGELALGERVRFVNGISDNELAELVASAEIAVVPSLYEGFSLPAVEHMASGTPLVASRTGALPEVTGDAAVLVEPGDPEELAAALRDLLDSPARAGPAVGRRLAAGPGTVRLARRGPRHRGRVPNGRSPLTAGHRGPAGRRGRLKGAGQC